MNCGATVETLHQEQLHRAMLGRAHGLMRAVAPARVDRALHRLSPACLSELVDALEHETDQSHG